jgi:hypothetical protein
MDQILFLQALEVPPATQNMEQLVSFIYAIDVKIEKKKV